jgi:hypothetical protein
LIVVTCDPGLTGAFCLYDTKRGSMDLWPMPTYTRKVGKADRPFIDEQGIYDLFVGFQMFGATHFVIEEVGGLPRQSAPAAFKFATSYFTAIATARTLGFAVERVRPQVWKTKLRVPADKSQARMRASEMIPTHAHRWKFKKDDGLAEAALLAVWAEQAYRGRA